MKVVERFLLDGIRRQRGNRAVDQRQQPSIAMLPGATLTKSARRQQAAAFANIAPDLSGSGDTALETTSDYTHFHSDVLRAQAAALPISYYAAFSSLLEPELPTKSWRSRSICADASLICLAYS